MPEETGITIHIPAPSEGVETVLILFGIGFLLFLVLAAFKAWPKRRKLIKRLPKFHEKISLNLLAVFALLMGVVWAALLGFTILGVFQLWLNPPAQDNGQNALAYRVHFLAIVGLMTALAGLVGAPLALIRVFTNERQTKATEEGLITDRINKAVEGLGAEKTVSRIGRVIRLRHPEEYTYFVAKGDDLAPQIDDPFGYKVIDWEPWLWEDAQHDHVEGTKYTVHRWTREDTKIEWQGEEPLNFGKAEVVEVGDWLALDETKPNLEVRIGAIYALERIAQDSDRDHVQIMEILCAYIRQNAPAPAQDDWPKLEMKPSEGDGPLEADWDERLEKFHEEQETAKAELNLREDIQTALTVIGRRSAEQRKIEAGPGGGQNGVFPFDTPCPENEGPEDGHDPAALESYRAKLEDWTANLRKYERYRLDLRGADLRGADLSGHDLKGAKLQGTYLQGANLREARLQGATLREARFQGADLRAARLQGADLRMARVLGAVLKGVRLQGAVFVHARLHSAFLRGAQLQGAQIWGAQLQRSDLGGAQLQGADLGGAQLQGANLGEARFDSHTNLIVATLRGAVVKTVDFTDIPQITEHLQGMFGDASVTLPGGYGPEHRDWPAHWPKFEMEIETFDEEWRKWQADPENYSRPDPPDAN